MTRNLARPCNYAMRTYSYFQPIALAAMLPTITPYPKITLAILGTTCLIFGGEKLYSWYRGKQPDYKLSKNLLSLVSMYATMFSKEPSQKIPAFAWRLPSFIAMSAITHPVPYSWLTDNKKNTIFANFARAVTNPVPWERINCLLSVGLPAFLYAASVFIPFSRTVLPTCVYSVCFLKDNLLEPNIKLAKFGDNILSTVFKPKKMENDKGSYVELREMKSARDKSEEVKSK